jgi:hypothetical protein
VDLDELIRFAGTFGKHAGDPGYLWYFDYDGDSRVDDSDLVQLMRRLGQYGMLPPILRADKNVCPTPTTSKKTTLSPATKMCS